MIYHWGTAVSRQHWEGFHTWLCRSPKHKKEGELCQLPSITKVQVISGLAIVAIVGEGMCESPVSTATFMSALAGAHINIRFIAQGSSERQVAVVVDATNTTAALRAVHASFF